MSKLNRVFLKLFGQDGASSNFGEFGSLAIGSPTTTKDISTIQSLPAWIQGWQDATIGTLRPAYQDMNATHYVAFYQLCYLLQMGLAEYDPSTTYYIGSIINISGQVYVSLQDNNIANTPSSSPSYWQVGLPSAELPGVIKQYAGAIAPSGYMICDGSAISRSTYSNLYAICGTIYGIGDGSTTFNIPDLRIRVPVGYKASDDTFGNLGNSGGEKTHTLTIPEIPSHTHNILPSGAGANPGGGGRLQGAFDAVSYGSLESGSTGGDGAHNNLQPYLTLNHIIKT